jgi:uncharacterized delta-60 repeat protein
MVPVGVRRAALALAMLWLVPSGPALGQSAQDGFKPPIAGGPVDALAVHADGRVTAVGGVFTTSGVTVEGLVRVRPDGSLDAGFSARANNRVLAVLALPDDGVLIGGAFSNVNGFVTRQRIARLLANGSVDPGFAPAFDGVVHSLALQADGRILVGGTFSLVNGSPRQRLARLNPDGSLDTGFDPGANERVSALLPLPDGRILVGGAFNQVGGQPRAGIARLRSDGGVDTTFAASTNGNVHALARQVDGKIVVGGYFTQIGGVFRSRLARLLPDGTVEAGFDPFYIDDGVLALALQADGRIVIGGDFTAVSYQFRTRLARLHADGTLDASFQPAANDTVSAIAVQADDNILVGGALTQLNGTARASLGRLYPDGSLDTDLVADVNPGARIFGVAVQRDGRILLGGDFTHVAGVPRARIARLRPDGSVDPDFVASVDGDVALVHPLDDGRIHIGGTFLNVGGQPIRGMARLLANGALDPGFNLQLTATSGDPWVAAARLQGDGKLLLAGNFATVAGVGRRYLARLNADGSLDATFAPQPTAVVRSLELQADGRIVVGGDFANIAGTAHPGVARLTADGSIDPTFVPGAPNAAVRSLATQPDGGLVIGGDFAWIGGQPRHGRARLLATGALDPAFLAPPPWLATYAFGPQTDDTVLAGGSDGALWRYGTDGMRDLMIQTTAAAPAMPLIYALAGQADGRVLLAGTFAAAGGQPRTGLARLSRPEAAFQRLQVAADRRGLRWWRDGPGVQFQAVQFLTSEDAQTWTPLGSGQAVDGGWALDGLAAGALPTGRNLWLRAVGQFSSGLGNGSQSSIRHDRVVYLSDRIFGHGFDSAAAFVD